MKILTHPVMVALGASTTCLMTLIAPLVSWRNAGVYHMEGQVARLFLAVLVNFVLTWLLFAGLFTLARHSRRMCTIIWSCFLLLMPWVLLKGYAELAELNLSHSVSRSLLALCVLALVVLAICWRPSFAPWLDRVQRLAATILGFLSLTSLALVAQLIWSGWQARNLNRPRPLHQRQIASLSLPSVADSVPSRPRVIWLLLDELSYQQVYESRFPGLRLEAFDSLAAQSTVFTHAAPPGDMTENVVPSLMTGTGINRIRSSATGELDVHDATSGTWRHFDPHDTIFQDALNDGYSTGVAGWYNPYCRILPSVLDHCSWSSSITKTTAGLQPNLPLAANIFAPEDHLFEFARSLFQRKLASEQESTRAASLHIADYRKLFADADRLLADSSVTFLFLHMPVPHPEGIYDRQTATLTTSGNSSYIDNLALADAYLAHVRQMLEQRGELDSSTIVVMGDHSWRTKLLWEDSPVWTAEDQAASHGGQFDDRPACIVKLPDQREPLKITEPFATIHMRALLDGVMAGRLQTPADLAAWASHRN